MQTITITTAQNIDIEYELAGIGDRFLARLIDYAIFLGIYMAFIVTVLVTESQNTKPLPPSELRTGYFLMLGIWLLMCVAYDLVCEVFYNGQTVGKRALKIKVASIGGGRSTVGQYLLRWVFRVLDFGVTGGSAAIVSVALTENRQRIGDIVAGTVVVKVASSTKFDDLAFTPITSDYEVQYPVISQLTDADVLLIHDVIKHFNRTRNSAMVYKMAVQIKRHLGITSPAGVNEYQFLETVLHDYKYLTAGKSESDGVISNLI
ncbi:RDD family protein [Mucilaginibacter agri]|uniref:RDD family protein n=1 Tax=Mucilaginibacter agri TaxID=2695265 RepID=A0A965ZLM0_9SPHI|nr:RDD family protein [Mucilaginibacter agri]NCD72312.1 RDD family protein [Mucilaginibacter agri]